MKAKYTKPLTSDERPGDEGHLPSIVKIDEQ